MLEGRPEVADNGLEPTQLLLGELMAEIYEHNPAGGLSTMVERRRRKGDDVQVFLRSMGKARQRSEFPGVAPVPPKTFSGAFQIVPPQRGAKVIHQVPAPPPYGDPFPTDSPPLPPLHLPPQTP